jgi:ANTAR domain
VLGMLAPKARRCARLALEKGHKVKPDWVPALNCFDPQARRIVDKAEGILIGLRRCSTAVAFDELLSAAQRHGIPVFTLAWALVDLANGATNLRQGCHTAQSAAGREWGEFFSNSARENQRGLLNHPVDPRRIQSADFVSGGMQHR